MREPMRVSLCPACGACPEVVLDVAKDEVRIGEEGLPALSAVPSGTGQAGGGAAQAGNLVRLTKEAWNTLVEKIQSGELAKL